MTPLFNG